MAGSGKKSVLVCGAGISGLAAATFLKFNSSDQFDVQLVEASDRIGGRVFSTNFGSGKYIIERGAQWVHGENGNPVWELIKDLDYLNFETDLTKVTSSTPLCIVPFRPEALFVTQKGQILPTTIFKNLSEIIEKIHDGPEEEISPEISIGEWATEEFWKLNKIYPIHNDNNISAAVLDWIHRYQNNIDGSDNWFQPSCGGQEVYQVCEGNPTIAWKPPHSYSTFIKFLLKQDPQDELVIPDWIETNKEVTEIAYDKDCVKTTFKDGTIRKSDHLILTISLGCLKKYHQKLFNPELDSQRVKAIQNLGFGAVNKIHLEFEKKWWGEECIGFNLIWDDCNNFKENYKVPTEDDFNYLTQLHNGLPVWTRSLLGFYTIPSNPNALVGWITGNAAKCIETLSPDDIKKTCVQVLKTFLGQEYKFQDPTHIDRTTWFSNPYTKGSYSYRSIESEKEDVWADNIANPILNSKGDPLVLFAGEHTHSYFYSTVHGAYDSGLREAKRLIAAVDTTTATLIEIK